MKKMNLKVDKRYFAKNIYLIIKGEFNVYIIKTLNNIAQIGLDVFNRDHFTIDNDSEKADGIVLRSFNMHDMEIDPTVKAIARAGAGVNNIPVNVVLNAVLWSLIPLVPMLMR